MNVQLQLKSDKGDQDVNPAIMDGNDICTFWLMVFRHPSEKYESQMGVLFPMYGKIKAMFQTTNQIFTLKRDGEKHILYSCSTILTISPNFG